MSKNDSFLFCRVSSEDQREGFSLDAQEEYALKYAKSNSLKIVKKWSVAESAARHDDREQFNEMTDLGIKNGIKDYIFDKVDRCVRSLKSALLVEEMIEKHDCKFHFPREGLVVDRNSPPQEKFRFYLGTIMATHYIDNLRMEIKKGMNQRLNEGYWNSKAPFGYKNMRSKKGSAYVEVDENEAHVVREIFELYGTGNYSYDMLGQILKSKVTNRTVSRRLAEDIISNSFYYGIITSHANNTTRLIQGVHKPIITKETWDHCQKIRGIRAANHQKNSAKSLVPKPFMGFLKCGECNHAVTGLVQRKASGKTYVYYHCANKQCPEYRINSKQESLLQQLVKAFDCFWGFTPKATEAFIETLKTRLIDFDSLTRESTEKLAEKRLEIKNSIQKLESMFKDGAFNNQDFEQLMKIREEALSEIKVEIDAYNEADAKTYAEGLRIIKLLSSIGNYMSKPGYELEKVRLARVMLLNPKLRQGTIEYDYEKPFNVLSQLTSEKNWWT